MYYFVPSKHEAQVGYKYNTIKGHQFIGWVIFQVICSMANKNSLPLYEKIWVKHTFSRVMDSLTLLLLFLLLGYRISSNNNHTFPWFVAFLCELWFTITWITTMSTKWTPSHTKTFLDRLLLRYSYISPYIFVGFLKSKYYKSNNA
jgi:hypothetical protein